MATTSPLLVAPTPARLGRRRASDGDALARVRCAAELMGVPNPGMFTAASVDVTGRPVRVELELAGVSYRVHFCGPGRVRVVDASSSAPAGVRVLLRLAEVFGTTRSAWAAVEMFEHIRDLAGGPHPRV